MDVRDELEIDGLESDVARTCDLVLLAAALADRMTERPPSPTLTENLRRLQGAVALGRWHVQHVASDRAGQAGVVLEG